MTDKKLDLNQRKLLEKVDEMHSLIKSVAIEHKNKIYSREFMRKFNELVSDAEVLKILSEQERQLRLNKEIMNPFRRHLLRYGPDASYRNTTDKERSDEYKEIMSKKLKKIS